MVHKFLKSDNAVEAKKDHGGHPVVREPGCTSLVFVQLSKPGQGAIIDAPGHNKKAAYQRALQETAQIFVMLPVTICNMMPAAEAVLPPNVTVVV